MKSHIVVIGGGMAGTAAAHTLQERGYQVTIIEKNDRLGGRIHSELIDGTAIEMGAGFVTGIYSNILAFLAHSGLDAKLYTQRTKSGILRSGEARMADLNALLNKQTLSWGARRQLLPLFGNILLGWSSLDFHQPWRAIDYDNHSVTQMFNGRAGREFLEYVVEPILKGYCYWSPELTSEAMLLIIGKAALMRGGTQKLSGGLQQIPEKAAENCNILLSHTVQNMKRNPNGQYTISVKNNTRSITIQASGVVCATTASVVPTIISDLSFQQREFFSSINYSSTALIAQTFKKEQLLGDIAIAFPRKEGSKLAAITVSSEPSSEKINFRCVKSYSAGNIGSNLCKQSDHKIITTLVHATTPIRHAIMRDDATAISTHVQRWPEALPMFEKGHFKNLHSFARGEFENPIQAPTFAGDYIGGPFIEGAFTSGVEAANRLDHRLQNN